MQVQEAVAAKEVVDRQCEGEASGSEHPQTAVQHGKRRGVPEVKEIRFTLTAWFTGQP